MFFIDSLYSRGEANYYLQNYDAAISDFDRTIDFNLQYAATYYKHTLSYDKLEDYESAIADYSEAIRLNLQDSDAYVQ